MKTIKQDELFRNLRELLKSKGIELQDGSITHRIRQGCGFLADAVNATQKTAKRAKTEVEKKLDELRQSIHEATAPKPAVPPVVNPPPSPRRKRSRPGSRAAAGKAKRKSSG